ncbi:unnamed protein product [Mesocestoides corti]|uniref:Beta-mannosidase n=1 Tax=Mesocestoides corti TaxID=53468 RepID=A0A0R3UCZ8_MESCO|nr:unnamed protein product [Mesocestoides corti]
MALDSLPLHVAFRSVLADSQCSRYTEMCPKNNQHQIDWSGCIWKMTPPRYFCPPHPKCSADLQVSINGGASSHVPVQFGRREDANKTLTFNLRNNGPSKSEGVRIELSSLGWPKSASQPGLRVQINRIQLRVASTGALVASNEHSLDRWSVSISSNGAAALIIARQGTVIYPDQELLIVADIFVAGLTTLRHEDQEDDVEAGGRIPSPRLQANVSAVVADPSQETNLASVTFDVVYKPLLRINPGIAPSALVDDRKDPPNIGGELELPLSRESFGLYRKL